MRYDVTVSVILPTFNRAHCILRAIESVYHQKFQDIELIIIDDCSNDGTESTVRNFVKTSSIRTDLYILERNVGAAAARNIGILQSRGKYITFIDSDSVYSPEKVGRQVKTLSNSGTDVAGCFCRFRHIQDDSFKLIPQLNNGDLEGSLYSHLLKENLIGTPAIMVKRSIFSIVGLFDTTLRSLEDWDLALRISRQYEILYEDVVLFDDFYSENSVNQQHKNAFEASRKILDKNRDFYNQNPEAVSYWLKSIGVELNRGENVLTAQEYIFRAFAMAPTLKRKMKYFFLFFGLPIMRLFRNASQK